MKNKSKVVLGLVAMVAATAGVGATATFAWFTTQNTATVNFASSNVVSDNNSITVEYSHVANNGIPVDASNNPSSANVTNNNAKSALSISGFSIDSRDVSGDGKTFYRPTWKSGLAGSEAQSISTVSNDKVFNADGSVKSGKTYYVTFGVKITNKSTTATNIYLDENTKVSPAVAGTINDAAASATRVAIWDDTTIVSYWHNDTTDATLQYLKKDADKTSTTYKLANAECALTDITSSDTDKTMYNVTHRGAWTTPVKNSQSGVVTKDTGSQLCTIGATASKTITVSMWIEGTYSTATDSCIGGSVSLQLGLTSIQA